MDFSGCLNDDSIGPTVQGCRGDFDFTVKFEKIFLDLIPTVVFIAICLPRIVYLARKPGIVGGPALRRAKLVRLLIRNYNWAVTLAHPVIQLEQQLM